MRQKRVKWIRKVVLSKHPVITAMLTDRYGEEKANKLTNGQVIKWAKKAWTRNLPGTELWNIHMEPMKRGEA
jgi:predicted glycosyl hydrolase (DUF1957 family)